MSSGPGGCWEIGLERVASRSLVCLVDVGQRTMLSVMQGRKR